MNGQISIEKVEQSGPYSLRVTFASTWTDNQSLQYHTPVPYLNIDHPNNALRSNLYTVNDGSTDLTTQSVNTVPDHFNCVEVFTEEEIVDDTYILTIDTTGQEPIKNWYGQELRNIDPNGPVHTYVYGDILCRKLPPRPKQTTLEDLVRRYLSPVLDGPNFRSLIASLVVGEKYNADNFQSAFDQLYVNKASSPYLERLGANYGVYQRQGAEMDDDSFRHYVQTFYNKKLTEDALYSMLEVFYDISSTRAYARSAATTIGPVTAGENVFRFRFDGVKEVTITIKDTEFTESTTYNASMLIDRKLKDQQVNAHCDTDLDGTVRLFSDTKGLRSSVEVLQQPTWINFTLNKKWTLYSNPNPAYMGLDDTKTLQIFLPVLNVTAQGRSVLTASYINSDVYGQNAVGTLYPGAAQSTLTSALNPSLISSITVDDADPFTTNGSVFIGFGFDYQQGPIPYVSKSGNVLNLSPQYQITKPVPANAEVNQALTVTVPTGSPETFPSSSLDLLIDTLVDMIPAGTKYKINKIYPTVTGLDDVTGIYS